MVEDIVKAVNHHFVYVSHDVFDLMIRNCKEKLLACSSFCDGKFKAFFDCPECNENQLIQLLDICEKSSTLFLGFIHHPESAYVHVYHQKIYAGEEIVLNEDTMILQDIPKDCFIRCYGNLIVIGEIKGCIDLQYETCTCVGGSFNHARIRIFDSNFQEMTYFSSSCYYYKDYQINREENTWDVVLESHQVKVA